MLEVLRDAAAGARFASHFWELRSVPQAEAGQPPRPVARNVGFCGNSITGWASKSELRAQVARLFRAFALTPALDLACDVPGVVTVFDVGSAAAKVAVKLEGELPVMTAPSAPKTGPAVEPEPPLTPEQLAKLESAGWRVLCVPVGNLCILAEDRVGMLLPFLGRVVDLLNRATAGEDVDVAPLVQGWEQRWTLNPLERTPLPPGFRFEPATSNLEVTRAGKLTWQVAGAAEVRDHSKHTEWRKASPPGGTAGQVTLVGLRVEFGAPRLGKGSGLLLRLTQGSLALTSTTPQLVVPASFDASKAFTLTAEFEPGTYQVFPHVSVAALR